MMKKRTPNDWTPIPSMYLSVRAAASVLDVHPETIRRLYKQGKIPVYGSPGWYRVQLADVLVRVKPNESDEAE